MNEQQLLSIKGTVALAVLLLIFVAERIVPASIRPRSNDPDIARIGRNLSLWAVNAMLSPAIVIPLTMFVANLHLGWRPQWMSGAPGVLTDIILLDLWIYWWHRANHSIPLLWRFHRVHHLDEWLDVSSSVRFHFGEVILSALARVPVIMLLEIPLVSVIVFETLVLILSGFQHSNVRLPMNFEKALSRVLITPSIHWVHHHVLRSDTDSNYGTLFSFWDGWFGSRSASPRTQGMVIGLDDAHEKNLLGLLGSPFR